ncbi:hypothetical protein [Geoglobus ahangari]
MRKVVVEGNSLKVVGDTFPVKDVVKKYGLKWDRYEKEWYGNVENYTAEQIRKLADEIGAELDVRPLDEIPENVLRFIPEGVKQVVRELEG